MKTYTVKLKSESPICFGAFIQVPKERGENHDDHEKRTWRERCNTDAEGNVIIPPFAFKNMLDSAAARLGMKTGKGIKTFKTIFETGIMVTDSLVLPVKKENVKGEWRMVPSDGKRAAFSKGSRVPKCFPKVDSWEGTIDIIALDDSITAAVLKEHMIDAGLFIGLGSHRVGNRGIYGRFSVLSVEEKKSLAATV
jgi:hypothetical protein